MKSLPQAVLRSRAALFAALLFCIYEALPRSLTTFRPINAPGDQERDLSLIFGLAFAIFIAVSISRRSSFVGDRVIFGLGAGAMALRLIVLTLCPVRCGQQSSMGLAACCGLSERSLRL
jgi:hypothetical protein